MHYSVLTHLPLPQRPDTEIPIADFAPVHDWFEAAMTQKIEDMMEPYDENTEIPTYLEFVDMSKSVLKDYHAKGLDVVRLSNGSICRTFDSGFHENYIIKNSLVFQRKWGPLRHPKRTKKAKRIQVIENYPFDKLYPSLDEFAKDWYGYYYNESAQAYGYDANPNGYYDWYQVGGRWPDRFLIAANDPIYIPSEKSWAVIDEEKKAPDGYRWVTGARKSAIQWELMKSLATEQATELFCKLEQWLSSEIKPAELNDGFHCIEGSIVFWGDLVCKKGTTLEQFLDERGLAPEQRFFPGSYYIIDEGSWECSDNYLDEPEDGNEAVSWGQFMERYLDGLPGDAFLVTLDCHD